MNSAPALPDSLAGLLAEVLTVHHLAHLPPNQWTATGQERAAALDTAGRRLAAAFAALVGDLGLSSPALAELRDTLAGIDSRENSP